MSSLFSHSNSKALRWLCSFVLFASLCSQMAFGYSRPSTQENAVPETLPELVVAHAVLLDENQQPQCLLNVANRSDLAPRFLTVSQEKLESSYFAGLRSCESNEAFAIQATSQKSVEKVQTAALPAVVVTALTICELTGVVGGVLGGATAAGLYEASGNVPGTIIGTAEGFFRLAGKIRLVRYFAGGPVGYVCGTFGDKVGHTAVMFVLEQAKKTGLTSH